MRFAALLALCLLTPAAHAASHEAEVDGVVTPTIGHETPGLGVLVAAHGHVLLAKGYGVTDIERRTPVTVDTVFNLASVSKQMTALIALRFAKAGKLDLAAPLDRALLGFRQHRGVRAITANDLIHHVSGLPDYEENYTPDLTNDDILAWVNGEALDFAPGTQFSYSNTGYALLASTLKTLDHANDFGDVLQREIFDPLKMSATHAPEAKPGLAPERIARGYEGEEGRFTPSEAPSPVTGDGGVVASIADLAKYEAALSSNTLIDAAGLRQIFSNGKFDNGRPVADESGDGYGFGWALDGAAPGTVFHSGSWFGTATYYLRDLNSGLTVIVLSNDEDFDAESMACAIAQIYGGCS